MRGVWALCVCLTVLGLLHGAEITGTIVVRHKLTRKRVTATADTYSRGVVVPLGGAAEGDPLEYERAHVVVYVEDGNKPPDKNSSATLEQLHRNFVPDLVVVAAGGSVSFPNLDPVFHNVFSLSRIKSFDLGNYPKDHSRTVVFPSPGVVMVNCHLHPNMTAAIVVTPNGSFSRADNSGHFTLKDVPPGTHTVVAWHKTAGFFRQKVEVDPMAGAEISFDIPLDASGMPVKAARE